MMIRIGVDLGGTKIEAIALGEGGETLARQRVATPQGDYPGTIEAIASLVRDVEQGLDAICSVGVGIPGTISQATGLVKNANAVMLNQKPLDQDLSRALDREVRVANDANCFALSEAMDGAAAPERPGGRHVVFGVIIGTGVGGGVIVNGEALNGSDGIAGEWGHNPLPWQTAEEFPGPACWCKKNGCIETYLSGPALALDHEKHTGQAMKGAEVVSAADAGEPGAQATLERYADRLARGLASIINVLDPNVVVLGGGVSNVSALYRIVPQRLPRYVFSDRVTTKIVQAKHGDSSGVRGAAWLWPARPKGEN
jgi:fructokinase